MSVTEVWLIRREEIDTGYSVVDPLLYATHVKRQIAHDFADFCALLFDCHGTLERVTFTQEVEHWDRGTPRECTIHVYTIMAEVKTENEADMLKLQQEVKIGSKSDMLQSKQEGKP